ncbi:MAG: hypothetical protein HY273_08300 [Gammaproteobacteria bacterium]|nr:hypothetical protein [Gammaproteobacteria bacterium]
MSNYYCHPGRAGGSPFVLERQREELVTRFFAYGDGVDGYKDRPAEFLFAYVKRKNTDFEQDASLLATYRQRFLDTMEFVKKVFPWGFRKAAKGTATPRARFEAIAIGSYLAISQKPELRNNNPNVQKWISEKAFSDITGADGANAVARLRGRMNFVRDRLIEG